MMNTLFKILVLVATMSSLLGMGVPEKKVNKVVSKAWNSKELEIHPLRCTDTISDIISMFKVTLNDKTLGYACYNMAFGCRIGGCPAPSQPNSQSYEIFNYIVVYDTLFNIKKVDIANYPGEYGFEICRPKWLEQFEGKTDGFILNENVDGVAGATVSAKYLVDGLNTVGGQLKNLVMD